MAKAATTKSADDKKKKKNAAPGATVRIKVKAKKKSAKAGKKVERKSKKHEGFEGLAKMIDHPMVADLLAAGAIAAVAAIAEHKMGKESSSKMVKSVGKAAAMAMGRKLMGDVGDIASAATNAAKKA